MKTPIKVKVKFLRESEAYDTFEIKYIDEDTQEIKTVYHNYPRNLYTVKQVKEMWEE